MPNQVDVTGRNMSSGWPLDAKLSYVDATLTDRTPNDPLSLLAVDSNDVKVRSAGLQVTEQGLNRAIATTLAQHPESPVTSAKITFQPGNRATLAAWVRWHGVPVPVGASYRLERVNARTVKLTPQSLTACGLPVRPLLGLLGLNLSSLVPAPKGLPAKLANDGTITLDLGAVKQLDAPLTSLTTGNGTLDATVGGPTAVPRRPGAWVDLAAHGDVDAGPGLLHDATASCRASGSTLCINAWQLDGLTTLKSGGAAIDPVGLKAQIQQVDPLYKVSGIRAVGTTYQVTGEYNLGLKLPVRLDLAFSRGADGTLRLDPTARVCGFGLKHALDDGLAHLNFLKRDGDAYTVDLRAAAGLDMPVVGSVTNEGGRVTLRM